MFSRFAARLGRCCWPRHSKGNLLGFEIFEATSQTEVFQFDLEVLQLGFLLKFLGHPVPWSRVGQVSDSQTRADICEKVSLCGIKLQLAVKLFQSQIALGQRSMDLADFWALCQQDLSR